MVELPKCYPVPTVIANIKLDHLDLLDLITQKFLNFLLNLTYMYRYLHQTCLPTHTCTHTYTDKHAYIKNVCLHTYTFTHTYSFMSVCIKIYLHLYMCTSIDTCIHTYTHAHIHTSSMSFSIYSYMYLVKAKFQIIFSCVCMKLSKAAS